MPPIEGPVMRTVGSVKWMLKKDPEKVGVVSGAEQTYLFCLEHGL